MFQNKDPVLAWFYLRTRMTVVFARISIVFKFKDRPKRI